MSTAREQLIADWQQSLAAAESAPVGLSQRQAWLTRMRIRLYRFLLSLYGGGKWMDAQAPADTAPTEPPANLVIDAPDVLPLAGKPAKDQGKIRTVLKAVAGAQDAPPASGPWAGGLPQDEWSVVAVADSDLDLARCVQLLDSRGIVNRSCKSGPRVALAVPGVSAGRARETIRANRQWLRPRRPVQPPRPLSPTAWWILTVATFAPLAAMAAFAITAARFPDALADSNPGEIVRYGLGLFAAFLSIVCVRPIASLVQHADRFVMSAINAWKANRKQPPRSDSSASTT